MQSHKTHAHTHKRAILDSSEAFSATDAIKVNTCLWRNGDAGVVFA